MTFPLCVLMLAMSPMTAVLRAQTTLDQKNAAQDFLHSTSQQRLILKGFSADPVVAYRWTGDRLVLQAPSVHTFAVIEVGSLATKGGRIEILARRRTLLRSNNGSFVASADTPAKLVINLDGADPATVLPQLKSQLFFANLDEALLAVPAVYKSMIPYKEKDTNPASTPGSAVLSDEAAATRASESCPAAPSTFIPPKIFYRPEPTVTEQAAQAKFRGEIVVAVTFLATGKIGDPWLAKPAGYGLDELSVVNAAKLRFKPATCDGSPVSFSTAVITLMQPNDQNSR